MLAPLMLSNCTASSHFCYAKFAMLIQSSSSIILRNAHFENCSKSTAVVLLNNKKLIKLKHLAFMNNRKIFHTRHDYVKVSRPGALFIQQNSEEKWRVIYLITHCIFYENQSPFGTFHKFTSQISPFSELGFGGAVLIEFGGSTLWKLRHYRTLQLH